MLDRVQLLSMQLSASRRKIKSLKEKNAKLTKLNETLKNENLIYRQAEQRTFTQIQAEAIANNENEASAKLDEKAIEHYKKNPGIYDSTGEKAFGESLAT